MIVLRYIRLYLCLLLVWIWVLVWGFGLSIAFFFLGHRRDFLPRAVRILARPILFVCGLYVEMDNEQGLYAASPCIYLANHQSGFDVPIFGRYCTPNLVWIAKKELGSLPFIGWVLRRTGNILIDRKNREKAFDQLQEAAKQIVDGKHSLVVLPEGTRNATDAPMLPFKRGPFHLAKAAGVPMIPVVCSSLKRVANMKKGYLGGRVKLRVLPPVDPEGTPAEMADQLRDIMLREFERLNKEIGIDTVPTV